MQPDTEQDLAGAARARATAVAALRDATQVCAEVVRRALDEGCSVTEVSRTSGLKRSTVYLFRDRG